MKFSPITQGLIKEGIAFVPIFIEIIFISYIGNKAYEHFGMEGVAIYGIIIMFAQLAVINKTLRERL